LKNTDWKFDKEENNLVKIRLSIKKNVFWAFGPIMFETLRYKKFVGTRHEFFNGLQCKSA